MAVTFTVMTPGPSGTAYVPVLPLVQYSGINNYGSLSDIQSGVVSYFNLDQNNVPVEIFDNGAWREYSEFLSDPNPKLPLLIDKVMTDATRQAVALDMATSGLFKAKTKYITVGDEVPGEGTIDFASLISSDDMTMLKQYLTFMPRQFLRNFFMQKIYPQIPMSGIYGSVNEGKLVTDPIYGTTYQYKSYQNMVWAGFVDVFNQANLEYVNTNKIDPWAWENQKNDAYYTSQNADQVAALQAQFTEFNNVTLALDPIAKAIMDDFATLPKLGDLGMEINRQNAIKELLKMKEYETAQAIVDAYRYVKDTVVGDQLTKPIPADIVLSNGTVMAEKTVESP